MGDGLVRKADALGHGFHVSTQIRVREGDVTERDRGVAPQFAANMDLRRGDGKTRTFVDDAGVYLEHLAGGNEAAHLGFLDRGEERHALELRQGDQEPAGCLRHRLDQQYTRHDRMARKVTFEDGILQRYLRLDRDGALSDIEVGDAVNQLEIFKLHDGRLRALGRDQFVDAGAEVFQDKVLFGCRFAVV